MLIVLVVIYFAIPGAPKISNSTVTTSVGTLQSTILLPSTTVASTIQYTTIPPASNSTATNTVGFMAFVSSGTLNSTLGGGYNQSGVYPGAPDYGIYAINSQNYNSTRSNVAITLAQYNTSAFAYLKYNQSYNAINVWANDNGKTYYSSTYLNASYVLTNTTLIYKNNTYTWYDALALYGDYIATIKVANVNSRLTTQQMKLLAQAEIANMSGYSQ